MNKRLAVLFVLFFLGDFFSSYAQTDSILTPTRIKIDGVEIGLLNDDEVLATVENPEDIFHEF